jgi:hypothetical protein
MQRIASVRASGAAVGAKQKREGSVLKEELALAGHSLHAVCPASSLYVPLEQILQPAEVARVPASQPVHLRAPLM